MCSKFSSRIIGRSLEKSYCDTLRTVTVHRWERAFGDWSYHVRLSLKARLAPFYRTVTGLGVGGAVGWEASKATGLC